VMTAVVTLSGSATESIHANRVVVFPLYDAGAPAGASDAEGVATYIGNALGNARPLTWVDGWELTGGRTERLSTRSAAGLARKSGARFYVAGAILRDSDSTRVALTLHDAVGDSILATGTVAAPAKTAVLPILGIEAVAKLLPALVSPGGRISLDEMATRNPRAIANFLHGEREYRRTQFLPALAHYEEALADDSALTLAAMRGAYAARWAGEQGPALKLARLAVQQAKSLPPAQADVARGLKFLLEGAADSAIAHLQRALQTDPSVHGAWTLLGETYLRSLPNQGPADSLAKFALEMARREDADFAPTLLLLEMMAMNSGHVRDALKLRDELRRAGADTSHGLERRLALDCVRYGPASVDFHEAVRRNPLTVTSAAKMLDGTARQPNCAIAAYTAIIQNMEVRLGSRWAAFLGLQAQFAATGRREEAAAVFAWNGTETLPRRYAYLIVAGAGAGFADSATSLADQAFRQGYDRGPAPWLWMIGAWETSRGNVDRVVAIHRALRHIADSTNSRLDRLLESATAARVQLVQGDTAGAIDKLRRLSPTGSRADISWVSYESLGAERLLLAQLLFAKGRYAEAITTATLLDAPEPMIYPLYLRSSLDLRLRAAKATGRSELAADYEQRLSKLSGPTKK
jgi:tetratricopeptide (TPR) repeat protein